MSVEEEVAPGRGAARGNVFEVEPMAEQLEIEGERPRGTFVTIPAYDPHLWSQCFQNLNHRGAADVAQMPDFIGRGDRLGDLAWQAIVGI